MKKHRLMTTFLIGALLMSGFPAQARSTANQYIDAMNTWIGEDADTLLHQWGSPVKVDQISEGHFEVSYQAETTYYHPEVPPSAWQECVFNGLGQVLGCNDRYDPGRPAYNTYTQCYTVFEVEDGTIIKWRWKGDCKN